jgi:hypothetical protein
MLPYHTDYTVADAIRNYETLSQDIVSDKSINYDFLSENEQFHVIRRKGHKWRVWHRPGLTVEPASLSRSIGPLGFRELDKKGRVERERRRAYASRLSMALFGGVALISPMLIMVLHPGLVVDLVTASVATVVFAFIIAVWLRDASGKDVLASTAAYAAVLVVFVGVQV